jgi:hypothetical protein
VQRSKQNLAKLAKIEIEALPLIRQDGAHTLREMVLEVEKTIQEAF